MCCLLGCAVSATGVWRCSGDERINSDLGFVAGKGTKSSPLATATHTQHNLGRAVLFITAAEVNRRVGSLPCNQNMEYFKHPPVVRGGGGVEASRTFLV